MERNSTFLDFAHFLLETWGRSCDFTEDGQLTELVDRMCAKVEILDRKHQLPRRLPKLENASPGSRHSLPFSCEKQTNINCVIIQKWY